MKNLSIFFMFIASLPLFAQVAQTDVDDTSRELEEKELTLHFIQALTGEPVAGAQIKIENLGEYTSNELGQVIFPIPENDGTFKVDFQKEEFIPAVFEIEIKAGTLFFNRFSVSPVLPPGHLRFVLDWEKTPLDLDAHLEKSGYYHVSPRSMLTADDGIARLDRDDRDGYGPETITVKEIDNTADYYYMVHDYSNRRSDDNKSLSDSKAFVKVYGEENKMLFVFQVPQNQTGTYWPVLQISNGVITPLDSGLSNTLDY
ncbi:hypothetical protein JW935_18570 [candidate division KSB1 bacterium]|nr:hypothetical protein [candidate division KSB1 bacterium]